jgi:hypothetical protein
LSRSYLQAAELSGVSYIRAKKQGVTGLRNHVMNRQSSIVNRKSE